MVEGAIRLASGRLGKVVVARLAPGCELIESIKEICEREGIRHGIILGGAASLRRAALRNVRTFPDKWPLTDQNRIFTRLEGPLEMLSISGNISRKEDGEIWVHAHVAIATGTPDSLAFGGHLVEGAYILSTGEISIAELEGVDLTRMRDPETLGLELYPKTAQNSQ